MRREPGAEEADEEPDRRPSGGRTLGVHRGERPGPLLVCVAGVHGNEPAGVAALRRVLAELAEPGTPAARGRFVALAGNIGALEKSVRYLDRDLNRQWTGTKADSLRGGSAGHDRASLGPEGHEQRSLLRALERELEEDRRGPAYLVDLHTTSGRSSPFGIVGRRERCRRFARKFPMPRVRGLERYLPGMLSEWACRRGFASLTAEAGQHDEPSSVDRHRAVVWTALAAAGLVGPEAAPALEARRLLAEASETLPRRLDVRYRHAIVPGDGFRMKPGRRNFEPVRRGDVLAESREGEIAAPESGFLFLPLYQELGSDGFFLVREADPN